MRSRFSNTASASWRSQPLLCGVRHHNNRINRFYRSIRSPFLTSSLSRGLWSSSSSLNKYAMINPTTNLNPDTEKDTTMSENRNSSFSSGQSLRERKKTRSVVAVIGTTGVGKSAFAVDIARAYEADWSHASFSSSSSRSNSSSLSSIPPSNKATVVQKDCSSLSPTSKETNSDTKSTQKTDKNKKRKALILSADSMQLYASLPLITNKVTPEEMQGIEHWGLGLVPPVGGGGSWEVGKWSNEAARKMEELDREEMGMDMELGLDIASDAVEDRTAATSAVDADSGSTLPIICGGTHYYIQHFLFPPSRLSLDRSRESERPSQTNKTKWAPPCPMQALRDHGLIDEDRLTALAEQTADASGSHAKSEDGGGRTDENVDGKEEKLQQMLTFLDTFYLPRPVFPSWVDVPTNTDDSASATQSSRPTLTTSSELLALHSLLSAVDPSEAARWHWRDGRKVRRGLERWWEAGASKVEFERQRKQGVKEGKMNMMEDEDEKELSNMQGTKEPRRTLIFWIYDSLEALSPRLDTRIDRMISLGLLSEVRELRQAVRSAYGSEDAADHEEGIFQSIGYKEFSEIPTDQLEPGHPRFGRSLERMKIATRQYAKSQLKWIKKQLLPAVKEARGKEQGQEVWVYVLPGGEKDGGIGPDLLRRFLANETLPDPRSTGHPDAAKLLDLLYGDSTSTDLAYTVPDITSRQSLNYRITCEICSLSPSEPVSVIRSGWEEHLKSKSHRSRVRKLELAKIGPDPYKAVREEAAKRKAEKDKEKERQAAIDANDDVEN